MIRRHSGWRALALALIVVAPPAAFAQFSGTPKYSAPDIGNFFAWQKRINNATPAANDTLWVLVHSSRDCTYCTRWKSDEGGLAVARKIVERLPNVRIFIVERRNLDEAEMGKHYPAELQFEYQRRFVEDELKPAVPSFDILLNGIAVYRGEGLNVWSSRVVPAVINIEKRREGVAADPAPGPAAQNASPPAK